MGRLAPPVSRGSARSWIPQALPASALALLCEMLGVRFPILIGYSTRINACEKGQWQSALALLCETLGVMLEPIII